MVNHIFIQSINHLLNIVGTCLHAKLLTHTYTYVCIFYAYTQIITHIYIYICTYMFIIHTMTPCHTSNASVRGWGAWPDSLLSSGIWRRFPARRGRGGVGPSGSFPMARPGHKEPMNESIKAIRVSLLQTSPRTSDSPRSRGILSHHERSLNIID